MAVRNGVSGLFKEDYVVNNVIEGDPLYAGKVTANGTWLVLRYAASTGLVDYANRSNNATVAAYADAWAARAALTYGAFETLAGF